MTGFGRASLRANGLEIEVEIRSVNHRHLQLRQRLPEDFQPFESELEDLLRKRLRRGAVSLTANLQRKSSPRGAELRLDLAKRVYSHMQTIKKSLQLQGEPSLDRISSFPGVIESTGGDFRSAEKDFAQFRKVLEKALIALDQARNREGRALCKDLLARKKTLEKLCGRISQRRPQLLVEYRDRLKKRIEDLLSSSATTPRDEDLAREVATFAARSDITEELTRLQTHLKELGRLLQTNGEVGRQLDFLLQEMHRETNTVGSKASDAPIAHAVIEMKGEIEKIREQVQNLE